MRENRGVEAARVWGDGSSGAPASRTMVTAVASLPGRREPSSPFTDHFADAVCRHHGRVVSRGAWLGAAFPT
ncbi:MAG TPA: hypothetical protein VNT52_15275, partial [Acidimicrobiales bacterium]|nr:hypothetical protein [Acidimicrobiales bacterium]